MSDSTQELIDAAEDLVGLIDAAPAELAFSKDGAGPFLSILDHTLRSDGRGPIRRAAERLRSALIGYERDRLARELAR